MQHRTEERGQHTERHILIAGWCVDYYVCSTADLCRPRFVRRRFGTTSQPKQHRYYFYYVTPTVPSIECRIESEPNITECSTDGRPINHRGSAMVSALPPIKTNHMNFVLLLCCATYLVSALFCLRFCGKSMLLCLSVLPKLQTRHRTTC